MKLTEAWHMSRIPYREAVYRSLAQERGQMWWGAFGRRRLDKEGESDVELTKRALRIAKFDKLIVAAFCVAASAMPFTPMYFGSHTFGLVSSISLSLAITFGFTVLYAIQTLSSFISAESSVLLFTLPLPKEDFSRITLFSFIRSVDYLVVGSILSQVALVAYVAASPMAVPFMFVFSAMNSVFAVAIALWFSRLFYRSLSRGGRSKGRTLQRLVFILMWGSLLLGVSLLLSIPWYIVPLLEKALFSLDQISSLLLCLAYPFAAGITISSIVNPGAALSGALVASIAMAGYVVLTCIAGRWTLETVKHISRGTTVKLARVRAEDFSIRPRSPLLGCIVKDLRISSRNPATAFFFALPVLETVIVSLLIANYQVLRVSVILVATTTGGIFALLMPLALLSAEGPGLEYMKTLPLNAPQIILSKALVSTATYAPVPLTLLGLALMKHLTSPVAILIPYVTILAIASASIFEIRLFLGSATTGKIAALVHDLKKLVTGVTIIVIPEVAYGISYFVSSNHAFAVSAMGGIALVELATAFYLLKRS